MPDSVLDSTGTPNTGSSVSDAAMPGKWAAPPAPAMMILKPAALAPLAKANSRSGVRCAETMRLSQSIPRAPSVSAAWRMVSQSDWLPIMMATGAGIRSILSGIQKHRPDYRIGPRFGKAWQGVRNGLSCLGESRQAFQSSHDEENQGARFGYGQTKQDRWQGAPDCSPARYPNRSRHQGVGSQKDCARRRQTRHSPPAGPTGAGTGADRRIAGLRRYRLSAGNSQPARL